MHAMDEPTSHMKPLRWLAHVPLVILPFLAAAAIEGPRLQHQVEGRVMAALAAAGQGWATFTVAGRDVEIRGLAPDRGAADAARAAVTATPGVRRVDVLARVPQP